MKKISQMLKIWSGAFIIACLCFASGEVQATRAKVKKIRYSDPKIVASINYRKSTYIDNNDEFQGHVKLDYYPHYDLIRVQFNKNNEEDADLINLDRKEINKYIKSGKISTLELGLKMLTISGPKLGTYDDCGAHYFAIDATQENVRAIIEACGGYDFVDYGENFPRDLMP